MKIILFLLLTFPFCFAGCYYDNAEQLYPTLAENACDTINVTYTKNIEPFINQFCVSCHGNNSSNGYNFSNIENIKTAIDRIYGSIDFQSGYSSMPKYGTKLDDCKIKMVKIWKDSNMPY